MTSSRRFLYPCLVSLLVAVSWGCGPNKGGKKGSSDAGPTDTSNRERCDNGLDDDGNGKVDCDDPVCSEESVCDGRGGDEQLDPSEVPAQKSVPFAEEVSFLFDGDTPPQRNVDPSVFDEPRVGVVRGKVETPDGEPLTDVRVSVEGRPEFGWTLTRKNGRFDLAVNGGGSLPVQFEKQGHIDAQRSIRARWADYTHAPTVVLVPYDDKSTTIDFSKPIEVARSSLTKDDEGERTTTLMFRKGTEAKMKLPDGSSKTLPKITVRATEFTVGDSGPQAMPGELPPSTDYTFAAEYSVDQAVEVGAETVEFDKPVVSYTDNFLDFPVGEGVPAGYYDRLKNRWTALDNGDVVRVTDVSGGEAELEGLSNGEPSSAELKKVAELFDEGDTLWRLELDHFSPHDLNWPPALPADAVRPNVDDPLLVTPIPNPCAESGSILACEDQVLGKRLDLVGPFSLHYSSDRTSGRSKRVTAQLHNGSLPPSVDRVEVVFEIAGQRETAGFSAGNVPETHTFEWDGRDGYGRRVRGTRTAHLTLRYQYEAVYGPPLDRSRSFGFVPNDVRSNGGSSNRGPTRDLFTLSQTWTFSMGTLNLVGEGFGGWSLGRHHRYEPGSRVLHLGDGRTVHDIIEVLAIDPVVSRLHSEDHDPGYSIRAQNQVGSQLPIVAAADGSVYLSDQLTNSIYRIDRSGSSKLVVGDGKVVNDSSKPAEDGSKATDVALERAPRDLAMGPQNRLHFIDDSGYPRIRRLEEDGTLTELEPKPRDRFKAIAFGIDGSLYTAEVHSQGSTIKQWLPEGSEQEVNLSILARRYVRDLAVLSTGTVVILHADKRRESASSSPAGLQLHALRPDGSSRLITDKLSEEGRTRAFIEKGPVDRLFVGAGRLWRVTLDGDRFEIGGSAFPKDGLFKELCREKLGGARPARDNCFTARGVAVRPDGEIFVSDHRYLREGSGFVPDNVSLYRIGAPRPDREGLEVDNTVLGPAGKRVYEFDRYGQHLRTLDPRTGKLRFRFRYDSDDRLTEIEDANGRKTSIQRNDDGRPTQIQGPDGRVSTFSYDKNGQLEAVENPGGEKWTYEYGDGGLLVKGTNPLGDSTKYAYDKRGRLVEAIDPLGNKTTLQRSIQGRKRTVTLKRDNGTTETFSYEPTSGGGYKRVATYDDDLRVVTEVDARGNATQTRPDGTVVKQTFGPDPRFGMRAPIMTKYEVKTPSGKTYEGTMAQSVKWGSSNSIFDIKRLSRFVERGDVRATSYYEKQKDGTGFQLRHTRPADGFGWTATYDDEGRVASFEPNGLAATKYSYDDAGRLTELSRKNRTVRYEYDSKGTLSKIERANGDTVDFSANGVGRIESFTSPGTSKAQLDYDAIGRMTKFTTPGGSNYKTTFDAAGRRTEMHRPTKDGTGSEVRRYSYDAGGRMTEYRSPGNRQVKSTWLPPRRQKKVTAGNETLDFKWNDKTGKLTSVSFTDGADLSFQWDGPLRTHTTWSGPVSGVVERNYDDGFRPFELSVQGARTIRYRWDGAHRIERISDRSNDAALGLQYSRTHGLLESTVAASGATSESIDSSIKYDAYGEPTVRTVSRGNTTLFEARYSYDKLGRITELEETVDGTERRRRFDYDGRDALTRVQVDDDGDGMFESGETTRSWTWDDDGNRTAVETANRSLTSSDIQHDARNRLLKYGDLTFTYDGEGRIETRTDTGSGSKTTYEFDGFSNLRKVELPGGKTVEYVTDAAGRRVARKVDGNLTSGFVYVDRLKPAAQLDSNGNVVAQFAYATRVNVPDLMYKNGKTYRIVTDHLGSVRLVVEQETGNIVQKLRYDEWGRVLQDTNPGFQPFGFAGGLYDPATGLVQFGMRNYDPEIGRWLSPDPAGPLVDIFNVYAYARNNPANFVDPTGLSVMSMLGDAVDSAVSSASEGVSSGFDSAIDTGADLIIEAGRGFGTGAISRGTQYSNKARGKLMSKAPQATGDVLTHCVVSCELARFHSAGYAHVLGFSKEYIIELMQSLGEKEYASPAEHLKDQHNNRCGRRIAERMSPLDRFTPEYCTRECLDAVPSGNFTGDPDTLAPTPAYF